VIPAFLAKESAFSVAESVYTLPHTFGRKHVPEPVKKPRPSKRLNYYKTQEWSDMRAFVLYRDGGICRYCRGWAATADHVRPRKYGGSDLGTNMVATCRRCNGIAKNSVFPSLDEKRAWIVEQIEVLAIGCDTL
jgi:5-methylcytosine-specific restriction endonuclease McrA